MPDFQETLRDLKNTEGFFQRETQEYKDFRNALSDLNKAMQAVGNRALTDLEVRNLRQLFGRAKETWDRYHDPLISPDQPLSERDENRLLILNSMTWLLETDLNAIRNYDPSRNLNLEQLILEDRGLNLDIRGKHPATVGQAFHSRLVVETGEQKGVFTEDYTGKSANEACEEAAQKYPHIGTVIRNMRQDDNYGWFWTLDNVSSPEDLYNKLMDGSDDRIRLNGETLSAAILRWGVAFPAKLQDGTGKTWMKNPAFVRQISDAIYNICLAERSTNAANLARFNYRENVPRRSAAMSVMSDMLGMPGVLARSKVAKIRTDDGDKTGVFTEWGEGADIMIAQRKNDILPDHAGKRHDFNSARVLKSAADLQVLDFICGNVARTANNLLYQFEEINGVQTLVGIQGVDNYNSFGRTTGEIDDNKMPRIDALRVMTRSMADKVLSLTREEFSYSLYGLVKQEYIDAAWNRTVRLQNKIRESMKAKWKSDTSMRTDAIHILEDGSPAWSRLTARELLPNIRGNKDSDSGIFLALTTAENELKRIEDNNGIKFEDHTRFGVRKNYYKESEESLLYGYVYEVRLPSATQQLSSRDVFMLYRNRRTLHADNNAIQKGKQVFNTLMTRIKKPGDQIQVDIGWEDKCDMIYIDGQPASEYVRKYSPDHAGNKDYVKAQIAAAVTSGRHHVDVVTLRTRDDGTFQAEATELTADLSALNEYKRWGESTREERRKSLMKDEDARLARQKAIETSVLENANRVAAARVDELRRTDPVRARVYATIPYSELFKKTDPQREKRLDWEIEMLEKSRIQDLVESKKQQRRQQQFAAARAEFAQAPAVQAQEQNGLRKERISLDALNLDPPKRRAGQNPPQQNQHQQNQVPRRVPQNPNLQRVPQHQQPQNPQHQQPQIHQPQIHQPQHGGLHRKNSF